MLKSHSIGTQSMVLQNLYYEWVHNQLITDEGKKGQLFTGGIARLLTDDEFFNKVVAHVEDQEAAEKKRKVKKQKRETYGVVLGDWKEGEAKRKVQNDLKRTQY